MSPDVLLKCPRTGCPESKCYGESLDFPPIVPQEKNITVKLARHSPPPPPSDNSKNGFKLIDTIPNHHSPPKITTLTTFKGDAKFSDLYLLLFPLYILCIFFVSSLYFLVSSLYFFVFPTVTPTTLVGLECGRGGAQLRDQSNVRLAQKI